MQSDGNSTLHKGLIAFGFVLAVILAFVAGAAIARPKGPLAVAAANLDSSSTMLAGVLNVYADPPSDVMAPADFKQFWDLWRRIKEKYYQ